MSRGSTLSSLDGSASRQPAYETPSALARSPRFQDWALGASIVDSYEPSTAAKLEFEGLCEFKLPSSFLDSIPKSSLRNADLFYPTLKAWATSHPTSVVDDDIHRISEEWQILCHAHFNFSISTGKKANEASQRLGVDTIIQLAFDSHTSSVHNVLSEAELRMRASTSDTVRVGANATSDTLVVLPVALPLQKDYVAAMMTMVQPAELSLVLASTFWSEDTSERNSIIVFPCEHKTNDGARNKNQLVMDFGAAQSQRRALGLPPAIIWGATCAMGYFEVFSSEWENDYIQYASHHKWKLCEPVDFMKCYSFLCNLAGATATSQRDLKAMDGTSIAKSVVAASWRALTPPTSAGLGKRERSDNGGRGADPSPMGGKNTDGVDDFEPEESNEWHESVKRWQLECQRPDFERSKFGFPLKSHLVKLQPTLLRSTVDEWSANILSAS